jgi:HAE1 family hydrophobic/amphiphilic exporter-1
MARFFVHRPIVAIVISLLVVIIGTVTITFLPVSQYPNITPPEIVVQATYPGADAITVEKSVATPIEQQMSGVDNMNYMYSLNSNTGQMKLRVNFSEKTNPNTDQILTQMRQSQAAAQLPPEVSEQGVTVQKSFSNPLLLIALYSPDGRYDSLFLSNYAYINLNDQLVRVPGISSVQVFGAAQYAMRVWVDPKRLGQLGITVPDIVQTIQQQNKVNPAGQLGSEPAPPGQEFTYTALNKGRIRDENELGDVILNATPDGSLIRVRDVGRVELGAQNYYLNARLNGKPSAIIAIYQLPGSNALTAARGINDLMRELKSRFPQGLDYEISLDTTLAVSEGLKEIRWTLVEALALVMLVVFLFLQSWRATLIPLLAVPVSLVGTFILFPLLGFGINTLSLFGLVLAIGLVVDDAIVVVEAVEKKIEQGLAPKDATIAAMSEITGPVIAVALVLAAVFVPTAFVPGITGRLYQQFAVTIAVSVILSAATALSLAPALCGLLLRPRKKGRGLLSKLFGRFNHLFDRATNGYVRVSQLFVRRGAFTLILIGAFAGIALLCGQKMPASFLPDEDQGYFFVNLQLPEASSLQRTNEVCRKVEQMIMQSPGVQNVSTVVGFSLISGVQTSYSGFFFVSLKPWNQRKGLMENYQVIKGKLNLALYPLAEGVAFGFSPPAIPGLGASGGVTFVLEDRTGADVPYLAGNLNTFLAALQKRPEVAQINSTFLSDVPQVYVDVDRDKVLKQGVKLSDVFQTMQAFMGGAFVDFFNKFGRQWQVYVQAEGDARHRAEQVADFWVKNAQGNAVPLSSVVSVNRHSGPEFTMRYNLYRCAQITANPAPGYTSAQAMTAFEDVFRNTMPAGMGFDYVGMSFQQQKAQQGIPIAAVFGFSFLFVFLILAALYESWTLPLSVLLSTPVAVFGTLLALYLRRRFQASVYPAILVQMEFDVFAQIGLIMIIGLVAKNAILIIEFAREQTETGMNVHDAALAAARLPLRPILMTSFAFVLGCVPLWMASGAGALSRQVMGTAVIGGMLAATLLAIFLIPSGFCLVERISKAQKARPSGSEIPQAAS